MLTVRFTRDSALFLSMAFALSACELVVNQPSSSEVSGEDGGGGGGDGGGGGGAPTCDGGPTVFSTNMSARRVIGQADFVASSANRGGSAAANTLNNPVGIAVKNGRIYIADAGNNRVLVYNSIPSSDGASADAVIGQADFTSTTGGTSATAMSALQQIAVSDDYLAVAEWSNNRVSFWPLSNPSSIAYVWGQPNPTTSTANNGGLSDHSLSAPAGFGFGGGKFLVQEAGNNRVLIFNGTNIITQQSALNVVGQPNMTSNASGTGANQMGYGYGLSTDGTNLVIVDANSDRLLIYNSIPTTDGATADVVWGGWGVSATKLNGPVGAFVGGGKLFVADRGSDRVLVFNSIPTSAAQTPDAVLGQANYTSSDHNQCSCTTAAANTLWGVHHVHWDGCRLYVTDKQNSRVLIY